MAIVKDLKPGAVLWKMASGGAPILIRLKTRRGRTKGARIPEEAIPYFKKLGIKITDTNVAVGCEHVFVSLTQWGEASIDEVAARYYRQVVNEEFEPYLHLPPDPVEEWKAFLERIRTLPEHQQGEIPWSQVI